MKNKSKNTSASQGDSFSLELSTVAFVSSVPQVLNARTRKLRSAPVPKSLTINGFRAHQIPEIWVGDTYPIYIDNFTINNSRFVKYTIMSISAYSSYKVIIYCMANSLLTASVQVAQFFGWVLAFVFSLLSGDNSIIFHPQ